MKWKYLGKPITPWELQFRIQRRDKKWRTAGVRAKRTIMGVWGQPTKLYFEGMRRCNIMRTNNYKKRHPENFNKSMRGYERRQERRFLMQQEII